MGDDLFHIDIGIATPKKRPETPSKIPPNHAASFNNAAASASPKGSLFSFFFKGLRGWRLINDTKQIDDEAEAHAEMIVSCIFCFTSK